MIKTNKYVPITGGGGGKGDNLQLKFTGALDNWRRRSGTAAYHIQHVVQ
jgi:hypothetical protein